MTYNRGRWGGRHGQRCCLPRATYGAAYIPKRHLGDIIGDIHLKYAVATWRLRNKQKHQAPREWGDKWSVTCEGLPERTVKAKAKQMDLHCSAIYQ